MTTSMTLMTPTGGDGAAAGATRALNQDQVTNVTPDLLDALLARDNLWRAWKRVKANRERQESMAFALRTFPPTPGTTGRTCASRSNKGDTPRSRYVG